MLRRIWLLSAAAACLAGAGDFDAVFERLKREANPAQMYAFLYDLPKGGDLHHHLGLSFLAEDLWAGATDPAVTQGNEFYARIRVSDCKGRPNAPLLLYANVQRSVYQEMPACEKADFVPLRSLSAEQRGEWLSALRLDRDREGRNEFFEVAVPRTAALVRDPNVLRDQILRMLKRYRRENIRYVESQGGFNGFLDQRGASVPTEQIGELFRELLKSEAARATGVTMRLQMVVIRFQPEAEKMLERAYELVSKNRDLWVGINMAGREDNEKGHALRFLETFRAMRRRYSGIHLAIHAGEKNAPGPEVRNTLLLGAERIGHGFNLITDPEAMLLMRNGRNLVEVSLVSNQLLEFAPDVSKHPFIEYLRFGIPVCLNTDDSGSWDSQLTDEYFLAVRHFDLTWGEVVRIGRMSLEHAFVEAPEKARLLADYDRAVTAFEAKYASGDWRAKVSEVKPAISGYATRQLGIGPAAQAAR